MIAINTIKINHVVNEGVLEPLNGLMHNEFRL